MKYELSVNIPGAHTTALQSQQCAGGRGVKLKDISQPGGVDQRSGDAAREQILLEFTRILNIGEGGHEQLIVGLCFEYKCRRQVRQRARQRRHFVRIKV